MVPRGMRYLAVVVLVGCLHATTDGDPAELEFGKRFECHFIDRPEVAVVTICAHTSDDALDRLDDSHVCIGCFASCAPVDPIVPCIVVN